MRNLFILLILPVMFGIISGTVRAQTIDDVTVKSWSPDPGFAQFVRHGKLVNHSFDGLLSGPDSINEYQNSDGKWILLQDDPSAINTFLRDEIDANDLANRFLTQQLVRFLTSNITIGLVIDKNIVKSEGVGTSAGFVISPTGKYTLPVTPAFVTEKLEAKLKTFVSDPTPIVSGNSWVVGF